MQYTIYLLSIAALLFVFIKDTYNTAMLITINMMENIFSMAGIFSGADDIVPVIGSGILSRLNSLPANGIWNMQHRKEIMPFDIRPFRFARSFSDSAASHKNRAYIMATAIKTMES